jgi:hypothetical protein
LSQEEPYARPIAVPAPHAFIDGTHVTAASGQTFETMMPWYAIGGGR